MDASMDGAEHHTEDAFKRELEAEMLVDLDRLEELSRYGIPQHQRRQVWKYLLRVSTFDKREEISKATQKNQDFEKLAQAGFGERLYKKLLKRFHELYWTDPRIADKRHHSAPDHNTRGESVTVILSAFAAHHSVKQVVEPHSVAEACWCNAVAHVLFQVWSVMEEHPIDAYYGVVHFMNLFSTRSLQFVDTVRSHVASLTMLFRYTLPALHHSFEAEEVNANGWSLEWVSTFLASSLRQPDLLRLWDHYLANPKSAVALHVYVCLALLQVHSERLMELEKTEILEFLHRLPSSPMEKVIALAFSIREDVLSRGILS
eukprot:TRINITY_DN10302_c0_g1_i1.p1 TRINITY_DN10302_c0_g1~~TRINITY_DN10302_c0_g1_i1.p1  ORF type:complete len:354 (+),score=141.65 TRINITY_DN10302_c0_g1_i1:112-1062(+)